MQNSILLQMTTASWKDIAHCLETACLGTVCQRENGRGIYSAASSIEWLIFHWPTFTPQGINFYAFPGFSTGLFRPTGETKFSTLQHVASSNSRTSERSQILAGYSGACRHSCHTSTCIRHKGAHTGDWHSPWGRLRQAVVLLMK